MTNTGKIPRNMTDPVAMRTRGVVLETDETGGQLRESEALWIAAYTDWLQRAQTGDHSRVVVEIEQRQGQVSVPPHIQALWNYAKGIALFVGRRTGEALVTVEEIIAAGRIADDDALVALGLAAQARLLNRTGSPLKALYSYGQAESLLRRNIDCIEDSPTWPGALVELFACALDLDSRERADHLLSLCRRFPEERLLAVERLAIAHNTAEVRLWDALRSARVPPFTVNDGVLEEAVEAAGEANRLAEKIGIVVAQADPLLWQGIWHAWSGDAALGVSMLEPILEEGAQHLDTMRLTGSASRLRGLRRAGLRDRLAEVAAREASMAAEATRSRSPAGIAYLWERAVAEHPELEDSGSQLGHLLRLWEQRDRERVEFAHDLLELRITHDEVESKRQELDDLARRDPLTGVLNRRGLDPLLRASARLPIGETAALLIVDVDRLKTVNDSHGHLAGDEHLQTVARALTGESRHEDVVARIGGDEFIVLAYLSPNATEQPHAIGERIRNRIAEDTAGALSVSIGVATRTQPINPREWTAAADRAMYESKRLGGNRVHAAKLPTADDAAASVAG